MPYSHVSMPNGCHTTEANKAVTLDDEQAWLLVQQQPSVEAYEQYIATHPQGDHVADAKAVLSPMLRSMLLEDIRNPGLRKRYLVCRSEEDKVKDKSLHHRSWRSWYFGYALLLSVVLGTVTGLTGQWIGEWLGWRWSFRVPLQTVGAGIIGAICWPGAWWIIGIISKESSGTIMTKSILGNVFWGFVIGANCGFNGGPLIGFVTGAIYGLLLGMIVCFGPSENCERFGPLHFADHLLDATVLQEIYFGEQQSSSPATNGTHPT